MSKPFPGISRPFPITTTNKVVVDDDDSVETSSFEQQSDSFESISDEDNINPLGKGNVHNEEDDDEDTEDSSDLDSDEDNNPLGKGDVHDDEDDEDTPIAPTKPVLTVKPVVLNTSKVILKPKINDNYAPKIVSLSSAISREEINTLLSKNENAGAKLDDILKIESGETAEDFIIRKELILKLANINNFKINNMTAVVAGSMITKKMKLGVTYDTNIENALSHLLSLIR